MDDHKEPRVTEQALDLLERIIAKDPRAFQREGETVYTVTKSEILEFVAAISRQAAPEAPTQQANSNSAEFDGIKTAATTASASDDIDSHEFHDLLLDFDGTREAYDAILSHIDAWVERRAPAPSQEAQAAHAGAVDEQQSNVPPPTRGTESQLDASTSVLYKCPDSECGWTWECPRQDPPPLCSYSDCARPMMELCAQNYGHPHDYSLRDDGLCAYCGHAEESQVDGRCRAQGGRTNDKGSAIATSEQKEPQA